MWRRHLDFGGVGVGDSWSFLQEAWEFRQIESGCKGAGAWLSGADGPALEFDSGESPRLAALRSLCRQQNLNIGKTIGRS